MQKLAKLCIRLAQPYDISTDSIQILQTFLQLWRRSGRSIRCRIRSKIRSRNLLPPTHGLRTVLDPADSSWRRVVPGPGNRTCPGAGWDWSALSGYFGHQDKIAWDSLVAEVSVETWFSIVSVCRGPTIGFRCEPAVCNYNRIIW